MPADFPAARFEPVKVLGEGGFARVWLARQKDGRQVAVKVLSAAHARPEDVARFLNEARVTARLSHPAIVQVVDFADGWIACEYLPGRSLSGQGPLPWTQVVRIGACIAGALAAAHAQGVLHRDVKPSNILEAGTAWKLADFGIASCAGATLQTESGVILATPLYVAPELARGEDHSPASDQYALAVTLYELLTGMPPFRHAEPAMLLKMHRDLAPVDPRRTQPEVPAALAELILRGLAKEPRERFASMEAFGAALEALGAPAPRERPARAYRGAWASFGSAVLVGAVLGLVTMLVLRPRAPAPLPATPPGLTEAARASLDRALAAAHAVKAREPLRIEGAEALLTGRSRTMNELVDLATASLAVERPRLDALDAAARALDAAGALSVADEQLAAALFAQRVLFWRRVAYLESHLSAYRRGVAERLDPVFDILALQKTVEASPHWDRGGAVLARYLEAAARAVPVWVGAPRGVDHLRELADDLEVVGRAVLTVPRPAASRAGIPEPVDRFKRTLAGPRDPTAYTAARFALHAWERGQTNLPERVAALAKLQAEDLRLLAVQVPALAEPLNRWAAELR